VSLAQSRARGKVFVPQGNPVRKTTKSHNFAENSTLRRGKLTVSCYTISRESEYSLEQHITKFYFKYQGLDGKVKAL